MSVPMGKISIRKQFLWAIPLRGAVFCGLTFLGEGAIIEMLAEHSEKENAPVVKGISRRPPEPEVGVRIPAGVPLF